MDKERPGRSIKHKTSKISTNTTSKTTKCSNLDSQMSSMSALTAVDISLAPHQSTSSAFVENNPEKVFRNKSFPGTHKINIKEISSISSNINENETLEQGDGKLPTALEMCNETATLKDGKLPTALEMCNDHLQLVPYQHNNNPAPEENSGPQPPPIPVSFTMIIFSGSIIILYVIYSSHHNGDDDWKNKAEKVMIQFFEVFARFTRHFVPIYWLTKKDETRVFALLRIKTFLLRYLAQDNAEKIMSMIDYF